VNDLGIPFGDFVDTPFPIGERGYKDRHVACRSDVKGKAYPRLRAATGEGAVLQVRCAIFADPVNLSEGMLHGFASTFEWL